MTLQTPVSIFQHEDEYLQLLEIYRAGKPKKVLEIGTYHGGTLYHWLANAPKGAVVVSVDDLSMEVQVEETIDYFDWLPGGVCLELIRGDSTDPKTVAAVRQYAPYDWVFIDGDHTYETVKQDWENYGAMVEQGLVVFHDIVPHPQHPSHYAVDELWAEIQADGWKTEELISNPETMWGGLGIVTKE